MDGNITIRKWGETNAPCKGCENRFVGCHSECERYKTFKANIEAQRQKRNEYLKAGDELMEIRRKRVKRYG